ncbi:MAG: 50S ribosomal protein L18e, partial [Pyrobaculum sp.]
MPPNPTGPTDRQTRILIRFLRKASRANSANIWKIAA